MTTKLTLTIQPEIVKEGYVFTVLITGANLSNMDNWLNIQKDITEYAGEKYPIIEAVKNNNNFFCVVLKPK